MKKIIAILLAALMIFPCLSLTAFAAEETHEKCPIIFIAGNSLKLVDAEGNNVSTNFEALSDDDSEDGITKEKIIESAFNIFMPFFMKGLPDDEWDDYGDALYEELAPIWEKTHLDGNGNTKYGVGTSPEVIAHWDNIASTVDTGADGKFNLLDYQFHYDWRLSPFDHADRLHEYIKAIIKTTGCSQVALVGRCIGGNVITAYLDKYGSEKLVKKVVFDEVLSNGCSVINDCFSGQIDISDKHLQSFILAYKHFGEQNIGIELMGVHNLVIEIVERSLDFITQIGLSDSLLTEIEDLYSRLYAAFMPAMIKATGLATWPNYWVSLFDEDFDKALELMFGEEGSEEWTENAGLIEKIINIRTRLIKPRTLEGEENFYKVHNKNGVGFALLSGYGLPLAPLGVHHDDTGDITVDTRSSSLGATTAGIYDTLPQSYIDERIAAGYGDYISPDGKIDASTCLFPETTWFIKNKHHDTGAAWATISEYYTQYTNVTVNSNKRNLGRFLIADLEKFNSFTNLTKENNVDGPWLESVEQEPTTTTILASFMKFLTTLLKIITSLIKGELNFSL